MLLVLLGQQHADFQNFGSLCWMEFFRCIRGLGLEIHMCQTMNKRSFWSIHNCVQNYPELVETPLRPRISGEGAM